MSRSRSRTLGIRILLVSLALGAPAGAAAQTTQRPTQGSLASVGPSQRTLRIDYTAGGCAGVATPSVKETASSVTISLSQPVDITPGVACPALLSFRALTVTLAAPLSGRALDGLSLQGGAFNQALEKPPSSAPRMPGLVGLSPADARAMLAAPPRRIRGVTPAASYPVAGYPVTLVVYYLHRARAGALTEVVAQHPNPGQPVTRHMRVVLSVTR